MRLSEWRATSPSKDAGSAKVAAVVDPVLEAMGAGRDPSCWVAWGDEPANRYTVFVPTDPGLIVSFVRVNVPGEGARATTKLVRWNRVSIGELAVETQAGHRLLSFQLEQQVLRGVDHDADRVAAFALRVIAAMDGRPLPPDEESMARKGVRTRIPRGASSRTVASSSRTGSSSRKPASTPGPKANPASRSGATAPAKRSR